MLVVGDKEIAAEAVSVRAREQGDLGSMPVVAFLEKALTETGA